MIEVKNLYKSFGKKNEIEVLKGITKTINKGDIISIIGPSGSGKSTFLRCLNLLEMPTSGSVTFEGVDITDPKTDINLMRQEMGMVFQHFNLFNHLTVLDNMTSRAQNQELFREIELITLLDGYDLPEEQELVPLSVHQWDIPLSHSEWENKYKDIPYRIYIRIGEYIGLDLDTLCKRHRISGKRHYALNLPQPSAPNWKSALGITAYVEAELTKQQIQRIAVDKRVRLIQGVEP